MIITSYGVGCRIERAANSVLEQTLDDVELVIVDDGSEDEETLNSLDRLANNVRIERLSGRRGAGAARNLGLSVTSRPYVLCLDGDDWVEPRYLELAGEIFESYPEIGIVAAWVRFEGQRQGDWRPAEFKLEDLLVRNRISSASAFRREASKAVGFYAEDLGGYEDWEHWISITAEGWMTCILPEMLVHYDWRPEGLGQTSNVHARRLVEKIVSKHRVLFQERVGTLLAVKHEQAVELESEAREAWRRAENSEAEVQRLWRLVGELGTKLEAQGRSFNELLSELEWARRRIREVERVLASAGVGEMETHRFPSE